MKIFKNFGQVFLKIKMLGFQSHVELMDKIILEDMVTMTKIALNLILIILISIVDGGCPVYTSNFSSRNEYRSSSFHSTLSIENSEQDD